jgi:hypothetical protein
MKNIYIIIFVLSLVLFAGCTEQQEKEFRDQYEDEIRSEIKEIVKETINETVVKEAIKTTKISFVEIRGQYNSEKKISGISAMLKIKYGTIKIPEINAHLESQENNNSYRFNSFTDNCDYETIPDNKFNVMYTTKGPESIHGELNSLDIITVCFNIATPIEGDGLLNLKIENGFSSMQIPTPNCRELDPNKYSPEQIEIAKKECETVGLFP